MDKVADKINIDSSSVEGEVVIYTKHPRIQLTKEEFIQFLEAVVNRAKRMNIKIEKDEDIAKRYYLKGF